MDLETEGEAQGIQISLPTMRRMSDFNYNLWLTRCVLTSLCCPGA